MKKSANVVLTLLIPAMAAFGCSQQSPESMPSLGGGSFSDASETEDVIADALATENSEGPEKNVATSSASTAQSTHHRGGYLHFIPIPWGGFRRSAGPMPSQVATGSRASAPPSTGTTHSGSGVVHGGFGSTGSHLSGGS